MADIETARQQLATARQILAEKKAQTEQVQQQLEEQERNIPSTTSQEALRNKFSSMQGRIQRKALEGERGKIQEAKQYVESYKGELGKYEGEISTAESQINTYERRVEELKREARDEARAELEAYKEEFEAANPGEQLIVDWSKLRVQGVSSGSFLQSMPTDAYNKRIEQINSDIKDISKGETISKINARLPIDQKIQTPSKEIGFSLFHSVSAKKEPDVVKLEKKSEWKPNVNQPLRSASYLVDKTISLVSPKAAQKLEQLNRKVEGTTTGRISTKILPFAEAATSGFLVSPAMATKNVYGKVTSKVTTQPVKFIGVIDESSGKFIAKEGDNIISLSKVNKINPINSRDTGSIGQKVSFRKVNNIRTNVELSDIASVSEPLGKAKTVSQLPKIKLSSDLETSNTFISRGFARDVKIAEINKLKTGLIDKAGETPSKQLGMDIGKIRKIKGDLKRNTVITLVREAKGKPNEFNVIASANPKLKIYKSGRLTYTARKDTFNIVGRVKFKGSSGTSKSNQILLIGKNVPVNALVRQTKTTGLTTFTKPQSPILNYKPVSRSIGLETRTVKTESPKTLTVKSNNVLVRQHNKELNLFTQTSALGQSTKSKSRQLVKQQQKPKAKQDNIFGFEQITNTKQDTRTIQLLRQSSKQKYLQKAANKSVKNTFFDSSNYNKPFIPKFFKPSTSYKSSAGRILHPEPGRYVVVVKRFGQDTIIGEAETLIEAKKLLTGRLQGTLAASGFIAEKITGSKQSVSNLFGSIFTSAKKDSFRLVQRRGKRLSSGSEISEIFGFKKRKGGRKAPKKIKWF